MIDKPLVWLYGEVEAPPFSQTARIEAGMLLRQLQQGKTLEMPHSRPMPNVGNCCHELQIRDRGRQWRIIYRIDNDAILILEVFNKNSNTTPQSVLETCQRRLKKYDQDIRG